MSTFRDLRDLINVSRLEYREENDHDDESNDDFDFITPRNNSNLFNSFNTTNSSSILSNTSSKQLLNNKPKLSQALPNTSKSHQLNNLSSSSVMAYSDRDLLLNRNSQLFLEDSIASFKNLQLNRKQLKPLPPLNTKISKDSEQIKTEEEHFLRENTKNLKETVSENDQDQNKNYDTIKDFKSKKHNFDDILTYVDASVVSEWLNRSNRYLKKMNLWHKENTRLFDGSQSNSSCMKYEPFVLFAQFWLDFGRQRRLALEEQNVKYDQQLPNSTISNNANVGDKQRRSLIEMEYSIICDEVMQAFQVGIDSQKITTRDVNELLKAVFKEYPLQLLSFRGSYLILDWVDTLSSDRHEKYKNLLSDVKCNTINKQYAQWLLSIRSFALINMCWSIVRFYIKSTNYSASTHSDKKLDSETNLIKQLDGRLSSLSMSMLSNKNNYINETASFLTSSSSSLSTSSSASSSSSSLISKQPTSKSSLEKQGSKSSIKIKKTNKNKYVFISEPVSFKHECYLQAIIKNDLPDVLHYLITTKKCDPHIKDEHNRTLVFLAVMNDKPKILNYLVKRWPTIDLNQPCELSGNTALHAAVNKGKLALVEILISSLSLMESNENDKSTMDAKYIRNIQTKIDINKQNEKCMNATALHLAVWNDYQDICISLLRANADPYLKMNGSSTAFDLARENSNESLVDILEEYTKR